MSDGCFIKVKEFFAKNKALIAALSAIGLAYAVLAFIGIGCPIRFIFGISCPGCGMTRALFSALLLDFERAFYYHPLWLALPPSLVLLFILKYREKEKLFYRSLVCMAVLLVSVYIIRLLSGGSDIVVIRPEESIFAKIWQSLKNK